MKVRFKFDADLVIAGTNMEEVKEIWFNLPLFSKEAMECSAEFCEILLVEDAETYDDLMDEYNSP